MSTNQQANTHGAVQALLPWFANETLPADEMALVRGHLRECPQCREDAAWQQRLRAAEPAMPAGLDPERALARLIPQLGPQTDAQADMQMNTQMNTQMITQPALQAPPQPAGRPAPRAPSLAERWRALWSRGGTALPPLLSAR
jgi:hypothetical protein